MTDLQQLAKQADDVAGQLELHSLDLALYGRQAERLATKGSALAVKQFADALRKAGKIHALHADAKKAIRALLDHPRTPPQGRVATPVDLRLYEAAIVFGRATLVALEKLETE